jgi:dTDP-glucose pyrophosphorylase
MSDRWQQVRIPPTASIGEAIRTIDGSALQISLVVDNERLCGTITDGDIRRAILNGLALSAPVLQVMNASPITALWGDSRELVVARMRQLNIRHMPIVDLEGRLVGLECLNEVSIKPTLGNRVVLMAGGLGKRLAPLTDDCPKPMLSIGGGPILESVLLSFIEYGFKDFSISVNYMADMITDYFGNGSRWGVNIDYLREVEPLGTAGALSLLKEKPKLPIILMNGDILTKVNFAHLLDFHAAHKSKATMCVRDYEFQVPYGVIKIDNYNILEIQEKPKQKFFVNAGIYVLDPEVLDSIPNQERIDMTDLFSKVISLKMPHAVFPIREYWLDIGRHSDLDRAKMDYARGCND